MATIDGKNTYINMIISLESDLKPICVGVHIKNGHGDKYHDYDYVRISLTTVPVTTVPTVVAVSTLGRNIGSLSHVSKFKSVSSTVWALARIGAALDCGSSGEPASAGHVM